MDDAFMVHEFIFNRRLEDAIQDQHAAKFLRIGNDDILKIGMARYRISETSVVRSRCEDWCSVINFFIVYSLIIACSYYILIMTSF